MIKRAVDRCLLRGCADLRCPVELGPALGMTAWREPTPEECVDIIKAYYNTTVDNFGRAMFEAVREVMGGGE